MSDIAIRVENLGKQYRIGKRERYQTLRDTLTDTVAAPFRWLRKGRSANGNGAPDHIWALKDLSFEIPRGEVVGVIGRNGAGKSTLLKVLSRITEPTVGYAEIHGRVGSLLEVGTGFHPELTGRENIYLNGAILGMRKAEIARKFDEIVAFAEIDKFLDTPVKHYSSGMYVRLAFAVAAHLEPEILVVDEVLAVGDAAFQKKCLGKMGAVAKGGRTIFFVSHTMAAVGSLCRSGILLDGGRINKIGPIERVIEQYSSGASDVAEVADLRHAKDRYGSGEARIVEASIRNQTGEPCSVFTHGDDISIDFRLEPVSRSAEQMCVVLIRTAAGTPVLHLTAHRSGGYEPLFVHVPAVVRCTITGCQLYPGRYMVSLWVGPSAYCETDFIPDILAFRVEPGNLRQLGFDLNWRHGVTNCQTQWHISVPNGLVHRA